VYYDICIWDTSQKVTLFNPLQPQFLLFTTPHILHDALPFLRIFYSISVQNLLLIDLHWFCLHYIQQSCMTSNIHPVKTLLIAHLKIMFCTHSVTILIINIQAGLTVCQPYVPEKCHTNQTQNSHWKQCISSELGEWPHPI